MTSHAARRFVGIGEHLRTSKEKKGRLAKPFFCLCHCGDDLNPFAVLAGAGVNFYLVALCHKNRHTNLEAG